MKATNYKICALKLYDSIQFLDLILGIGLLINSFKYFHKVEVKEAFKSLTFVTVRDLTESNHLRLTNCSDSWGYSIFEKAKSNYHPLTTAWVQNTLYN